MTPIALANFHCAIHSLFLVTSDTGQLASTRQRLLSAVNARRDLPLSTFSTVTLLQMRL
jgi:hypothetical protein